MPGHSPCHFLKGFSSSNGLTTCSRSKSSNTSTNKAQRHSAHRHAGHPRTDTTSYVARIRLELLSGANASLPLPKLLKPGVSTPPSAGWSFTGSRESPTNPPSIIYLTSKPCSTLLRRQSAKTRYFSDSCLSKAATSSPWIYPIPGTRQLAASRPSFCSSSSNTTLVGCCGTLTSTGLTHCKPHRINISTSSPKSQSCTNLHPSC
jgi:hypothetical protein